MRSGVGLLALLQAAAAGAAAPPSFWPHFGGRRSVQSLDGQWKYGLHLSPDIDAMDPNFNPSDPALTPNSTSVPMSMDVAPPGHMGPRGVAMYRTTFAQQGQVRLQFMGCSFYCRIFVDGKEVGDHKAGGFVPWWLDVPAPDGTSHQPQERQLFVLADNRFNKTTAPMHTGGDFWDFGGLVRSVVLHQMPEVGTVWVWRAHVWPLAEFGKVNMSLTLTDRTYSGDVDFSLAFDGAAPSATQRGRAVGGVVQIFAVAVPTPRAWSLRSPELHTVTVTVAGASVTERFGLRTWGVEGKRSRITLNDEVVKLHGWNHHTQWPDSGASPRDDQLDSDLQLLKEAGCNYVRGAHYPQDQRWLDRMDESGMAMWEETLGPGVTVENTQSKEFMKYQIQQLEEMLEASMNHPSILMWGWFNEGPSDQKEACPAYAACAELARARDPTRFQTWASNKELNDVCLDHASLISFNSYPAWYGKPGDLSEPKKHWTEQANGVFQKHPGKPFVISETGAGGLFEWSHNDTDAMWTTKYQTEVIERDVDVALSDDKFSGITLWHFFDFKGNDGATERCGPCDYLPNTDPPLCGYYNLTTCQANRPGGVNHKGVVDYYRRKKESYTVVAAMYLNHTSLAHHSELLVV